MADKGDRAPTGAPGPTNMTAYLENLLKEFELAEGSEDKEAQSALAELKEKMGALAVAEAAASSSKSEATDDAAVPDDLQLASVVDRLDNQLRNLEAEIALADEPTRQILQQSVELWLGEQEGPEEDEDEENQPIKSSSN